MNRTSLVTCTLVLSLVACDLLKKKDVDAGVDAAPVPVATTATAPDAVIDAGPAATLARPPAKVVPKAGDAGPEVVDAGAIASKVDAAAAPQTCCCKIGTKLSQPTQSDCAKGKGQCVAKEECEAKSCCCKIGDAKSKKLQSECSAAKGSCVGKEQCQ